MKIEKVLVAVFCSAIIGDAMCMDLPYSPAQAKIEAAKVARQVMAEKEMADMKARVAERMDIAINVIPYILSDEVKAFDIRSLKYVAPFDVLIREIDRNMMNSVLAHGDLVTNRCNKIIASCYDSDMKEYLKQGVDALRALTTMNQIYGGNDMLILALRGYLKNFIAKMN
jgi:hypothetical protein